MGRQRQDFCRGFIFSSLLILSFHGAWCFRMEDHGSLFLSFPLSLPVGISEHCICKRLRSGSKKGSRGKQLAWAMSAGLHAASIKQEGGPEN
jgi:hypothetical protein